MYVFVCRWRTGPSCSIASAVETARPTSVSSVKNLLIIKVKQPNVVTLYTILSLSSMHKYIYYPCFAIGFDCKGFIEYKNARKCRFCEEPLDASNSVKVPPGTPRSLADVCNDEDCSQRGKMICPKILACGCYCGGIKGETTCLPCLSCDLKIDDEFCHICMSLNP